MLAEFEKGLTFGEGFQEVGLSPDWVLSGDGWFYEGNLSLSRGSTEPGWAKAVTAREAVDTPVSQQRGCLDLCGLYSDPVFVSA